MTNKQPEPALAADSSLNTVVNELVGAWELETAGYSESQVLGIKGVISDLLARQELKGRLDALDMVVLYGEDESYVLKEIKKLERQLAELEKTE